MTKIKFSLIQKFIQQKKLDGRCIYTYSANFFRWPVDCNDPGMSVDKVLLFLMYNIIMLSNDGLTVIEETKVSMLQVEVVKFIESNLSNCMILGDAFFFIAIILIYFNHHSGAKNTGQNKRLNWLCWVPILMTKSAA